VREVLREAREQLAAMKLRRKDKQVHVMMGLAMVRLRGRIDGCIVARKVNAILNGTET
jgi:Glu-tRNA(Gln) amidotransferase subunit E-like FAD-binding protein